MHKTSKHRISPCGTVGIFTVSIAKGKYRSRFVLLGLGKTGSPRKLGVSFGDQDLTTQGKEATRETPRELVSVS